LSCSRSPRLLVAWALALTACSGASGMPTARTEAALETRGQGLADIRVSVRLDPRLTQGQYMGAVWVPSATYVATGPREPVNVLVRAVGIDVQGREVEVPLAWTSASPTQVHVSPAVGSLVTFTVGDEGDTEVTVSSAEVSRKFAIRARRPGGNLQVDVRSRAP
jgi:hypothetical protein